MTGSDPQNKSWKNKDYATVHSAQCFHRKRQYFQNTNNSGILMGNLRSLHSYIKCTKMDLIITGWVDL